MMITSIYEICLDIESMYSCMLDEKQLVTDIASNLPDDVDDFWVGFKYEVGEDQMGIVIVELKYDSRQQGDGEDSSGETQDGGVQDT